MSRKKPASLELALAGVSPEEPEAPAGKPPRDYEKLTVYVPRKAAKRLKQMALDHDCRVNDFLREGIDLMLNRHGEPSLSEFER